MPQTRTAGDSQAPTPRSADVRRNRSTFNAFYDKYDALVGLLCLAAREGISVSHERSYLELRGWFIRRYPSARAHLVRHLDFDDADFYYKNKKRTACDAFEALYLPRTIGSMFDHDGGSLIERLMRTQNALSLWDSSIATDEVALRIAGAQSEFQKGAIAAF